jgi:hypothetical protein
MLIAPALWNGYPLLQWDTGGYLARWYEGYLVPSRSTVFGLYLHFGEDSSFWINLGIQALATLWILQLTLRVFGLVRPWRLAAISVALIVTTALPWLASMLLTDIFTGLSVLALFILIIHGDKTSTIEKCLLFAFTAFAAATHSATLAVLLGLCCAGWIALPFLCSRIAISGLLQGSLTLVPAPPCWCPRISRCPDNRHGPGRLRRRVRADAAGRHRQTISADHCPQQKLKLCPYRNELPATADQFLWGSSMFNTLGRFNGLNDEMGLIVTRSLAEYPLWQAQAAIVATAQQLVHVGTGEGTNGWIPHTYGIIERYIPSQLKPMRAAHQQHWDIDFAVINRLHIPVALASMLAVAAICAGAIWRRKLDDLSLFAATVTLALLGNAFVCGVISGPHDRYGARIAWVATLVALIAIVRHFAGRDEPDGSLPP